MTLPTLAALQAEHPNWCFICGKWNLHPDRIHTCHEDLVIALLKNAITALDAQHEADAAALWEADKALLDIWQEVELPTRIACDKGSDAYDAALAREEARRKEKEIK